MADVFGHMQLIRDELDATAAPNTRGQARMRGRITFDMFCDDSDGRDVALVDVLADLIHFARSRNLDFDDGVLRAQRTVDMEDDEW